MAKTKHQKLAHMMQQMLDAIKEHGEKVAQQLNLVQLYFYEPYWLPGRPLMNESALRGMFFTHYLGLQNLTPDPLLRTTCCELPMLGAIINRPIYLRSECRQRTREGMWTVPWKVELVRPQENQGKLERSQAQALLYCPRVDEISNEIDWFERDMATDSLNHQLLSIMEYEQRRSVVRGNLLKNPLAIWKRAKEKWRAAPTEESNPDKMHDIAENPKNVDDVEFAPQEGHSLALAYEAVMSSIRARHCRHRQLLRKIYKQDLEYAMFENVSSSKGEKKAFLQEWNDNFFKVEQSPRAKRPGRWKQCEGTDDVTASQFVEHFVTDFIANPSDKKAGEIACVLWVLLWIAQEGGGDRISIKQVLQLTSQNIISDDAALMIDGIEVAISWGLKDLLLCLCGRGEGERAHRLFSSLDASGKTLERALTQASKKLLVVGTDPVLPGAFLISPHVYQGSRMSFAERSAMRETQPIVPLRHTRVDIKKALLAAQGR